VIVRLATLFLKYGLVIFAGTLLAIFPWVLMMYSSPLPLDLQWTGTALAATRTARLTTPESGALPPQPVGPTATATVSATPTSTATNVPTATATLSPTPTSTATFTITPTPVVVGVANETVFAYTCPGNENRQGFLEANETFTVIGWDETIEEDETITWLLIEDELGNPQKWIKDSEYLVIAVENFKEFLPKAACRIP